jgi:hypothetical protein
MDGKGGIYLIDNIVRGKGIGGGKNLPPTEKERVNAPVCGHNRFRGVYAQVYPSVNSLILIAIYRNRKKLASINGTFMGQ